MPGGDRDRRSAGDVVTPRSSSASSRRSLLTLIHHGHRFFSSKATIVLSYSRSFPSRSFIGLTSARSLEIRTGFESKASRKTRTLLTRKVDIGTDNRSTSMLSINMRIFKAVLLLVAFCSNAVQCLPIANETSIVEPSTSTQIPFNPAIDHYDQRQNGTENFRIHVDGVVFVFAPVETLLLAGAAADNKPNLPIDSLKPTSSKPEADLKPEADPKPSPSPKSAHRAGVRFANLLIPLLRRIHHE